MGFDSNFGASPRCLQVGPLRLARKPKRRVAQAAVTRMAAANVKATRRPSVIPGQTGGLMSGAESPVRIALTPVLIYQVKVAEAGFEPTIFKLMRLMRTATPLPC